MKVGGGKERRMGRKNGREEGWRKDGGIKGGRRDEVNEVRKKESLDIYE